MVITMELKHVILRGKTYHFRMPVPKDCVKAIGKTEVVVSLKTNDPLVAKASAAKLDAFWAEEFKKARATDSPVPVKRSATTPSHEEGGTFRQGLVDQMEKNLPDFFEMLTEEQLQARFEFYADAIHVIGENSQMGLDIPEIGIIWPLKPAKSPRQDRQHRRALIEVLNMLRQAVSSEIVQPPAKHESFSEKAKAEHEMHDKSAQTCAEEHSITDVAELMLSSKKRIAKTEATVRADVRLLQEWAGKKSKISDYTKKDLIDFVCNCLPYIPSNILKKKEYKGKSLRECVKLTKDDPEQYPPISHVTCGNRLVNIAMVFNYAKDQLGVISVNPAKGIDIPEVRVVDNGLRGFSSDELTAMWSALQNVLKNEAHRPSRFWATVLSLYHGFRLNEVCSLFLKDVYEDEDGVFVIDVNETHATKSVKNQSSVRIIPVHPFVRDQLNFKGYVESQKRARSEGLLFPDVSFVEAKGYRSKVSSWFAGWKKEWLAPESQYKHFHDLRYTFTQNAQNIAKMPDRYAQEITGHSIEGVSAVHLGYSGRLKPSMLLEELQKVKYGWETERRETETPAPVESFAGRTRVPIKIKPMRKTPLPVKRSGILTAEGKAAQ